MSGFEPELVGERSPGVGVGGQCLRLPPGTVERDHELAAEPFPDRVLADERLELGHDRFVTAEREVRLDPLLQRLQAQLFETGDVGLRERLVADVLESVAAPKG